MSNVSLVAKDLEIRLKRKTILNSVSFSIPEGVVFAVVGHNGAGKTTLFHLILGLKIQNAGEIVLLGKSNLDPMARKNIGYVPERPYINLESSFREFLKFHGKLLALARDVINAEIERVAKLVGLGGQLDQGLDTFSKGMLQKALIAQANLGDPKLLILDEPMSGLDPESRDGVRHLITSLKQAGKTLIFSSHALEDVEQLSDQVLILNKGNIQFLGTVSEWKASR